MVLNILEYYSFIAPPILQHAAETFLIFGMFGCHTIIVLNIFFLNMAPSEQGLSYIVVYWGSRHHVAPACCNRCAFSFVFAQIHADLRLSARRLCGIGAQ